MNWNLPEEEPVFNLPALTLQPLVENAIYHGVEPLQNGGTIDITINEREDNIEISISNPLAPKVDNGRRSGNQMAVENIRERLSLAFGGTATMQLIESETSYTVSITMRSINAYVNFDYFFKLNWAFRLEYLRRYSRFIRPLKHLKSPTDSVHL